MFFESRQNSFNLSILFALTNCALGCALGFYYGKFNLTTAFVSICIILCGCCIQALCGYSIDYSRAYKKHLQDKKLGKMSPIMIGEITLTQLRKRMALGALVAGFFGAVAIFLSVGNNIQIFSWMIFLCVLAILLTLFYTTKAINLYKGLGAIAIFVLFSFISIYDSQFMVVAASHYTIDMYPDAFSLSICASCNSLIILYVRSIRVNVAERNKKTLTQVITYEISSLYVLALLALNIISSVLACIMSHRAYEAFFIILGFMPMSYFVYTIIKSKRSANLLRRRFNQLLTCCSFNNAIWMLVLFAEYLLYY